LLNEISNSLKDKHEFRRGHENLTQRGEHVFSDHVVESDSKRCEAEDPLAEDSKNNFSFSIQVNLTDPTQTDMLK
jgi:hypothetical protein